jgi:hypothetical protein
MGSGAFLDYTGEAGHRSSASRDMSQPELRGREVVSGDERQGGDDSYAPVTPPGVRGLLRGVRGLLRAAARKGYNVMAIKLGYRAPRLLYLC